MHKRTHTHTHTHTRTHTHTHTHTHILVYTFERGPSLFFFVISFFTPNRGHTHQKIYMVIVDLTDTHGLVCDLVLSNRGPPYPYYTPEIYNTVLNAFLCDQQSSGPPLKYEDVHGWQRSTFACKNPDACPRLQVYTDPHTHTHNIIQSWRICLYHVYGWSWANVSCNGTRWYLVFVLVKFLSACRSALKRITVHWPCIVPISPCPYVLQTAVTIST